MKVILLGLYVFVWSGTLLAQEKKADTVTRPLPAQNEELGTNGSFYLTGGYGKGAKAEAGLNLNHRSKLLNIYGGLYYSYNKGYWETIANGSCRFPFDKGQRTYDYSNIIRPSKHVGALWAGLDYQIDKQTFLAISSSLTRSFQSSESTTNSDYNLFGDSILSLRSHKHDKDNLISSNTDINMERRFGKGGKLNADINYIHYNDRDPGIYQNSFSDRDGKDISSHSAAFIPRYEVKNETHLNILAFKATYEQKLSKTTVLTNGVQVSDSKVDNAVSVNGFKNGSWITDSSVSALITIRQPRKAVYSSLHFEAGGLQVNVGLRYEYIVTRLRNAMRAEDGEDNHYSNLLPSVYIGKKISPSTQASLNYSRSIRMPSYQDIAPNAGFNDIYGITIGNPFLKPVLSDNIRAWLQYKQCWFSVGFSREKNAIVSSQQTESLTDSIFYLMAHTLKYQENITLQTGFPILIASWWKMDNTITGSWNQLETKVMPRENFINTSFKKSYFACDLYSSQQFMFPRNILLVVSAGYYSDKWWGVYHAKGAGYLKLMAKKDLKNNGSLQLSVSNLLRARDRLYLDVPNLAYQINSRIYSYSEPARSYVIRVTYSKSFGGSKVKGQRRWEPAGKEETDRVRQN